MRTIAVLAAVLAIAGCKRGSKDDAKATAAPAATAAAKDARTHVWEPNTVVLDAPKAGAKEIERVPVGAAVTVEPVPGDATFVRIVSGTKKPGFLLARAVRPGKPDASGSLEDARAKLAAADLAGAIENAERAFALSPKSAIGAEALDLLEAIHEAQEDPLGVARVRAERKGAGLPAPTPTPDAAPVEALPAKAGDERFVSATKLLLKEKPDVGAKTVAELPIGTVVKVESSQGEWLVVGTRLVTPDYLVLSLGGDEGIRSVGGEERVVRGYARPRFLSDAPPSAPDLLAQAAAFEKKGELGEAVRRLERAAALDARPETITRLARVAANAKLYRIAARAAARLRTDATGRMETLDTSNVWGCRGNLAKAVFVDLGGAAKAPADACATNVPARTECPPCGPSGILVADAESSLEHFEANLRGSMSEEDAEAERQRLEELVEAEKARLAEEEAAYEAQSAAWEEANAEWQEEMAKLREQFPDGPFVRVSLPPTEKPLFLWSRPVTVIEAYCGNVQVAWGATVVSAPIPPSDEPRTVWVEGADGELHVDEAESEEALLARIEACEEGESCDPDPSMAGEVCDCCGC